MTTTSNIQGRCTCGETQSLYSSLTTSLGSSVPTPRTPCEHHRGAAPAPTRTVPDASTGSVRDSERYGDEWSPLRRG